MINEKLILDIAFAAKNGAVYAITTKASYGVTPTKHVQYYMVKDGRLMYMNGVFQEIIPCKRDKNGNIVLKGGNTNVVSDYYQWIMEKIASTIKIDKTNFCSIQEI